MVKVVVVEAVRKVEIPRLLRDSQAEWEPRCSGGFYGASLCAEHAGQLGGESPLPVLMEMKG